MIALIFSTLRFWRPLDAGSYQKCLKFTQQAYENTHSHWGYFGITNKHACDLHVVTWNRKLNCAYKAFGETLAKRFPMFVLKSNLRSYWGGWVGSVKVLSSSGKLSWVELCLQSIWWNASEALCNVCFEIQFAQLLGGVWFSKGAFVIRKIIMKACSRVQEMSIHLYFSTIFSLMLGAQ